MKVTWRNPPRRSRWVERLEPLKAKPGAWALVLTVDDPANAYSRASALNAGRYRLPDGSWEFTARKSSKGKGEVYARLAVAEKEPQLETAAA